MLSSSRQEKVHCLPEQWATVLSPVLISPQVGCLNLVVTVDVVVVIGTADVVDVLRNFRSFFVGRWLTGDFRRKRFNSNPGGFCEHFIFIDPFGGMRTPVFMQTIVLKVLPEICFDFSLYWREINRRLKTLNLNFKHIINKIFLYQTCSWVI